MIVLRGIYDNRSFSLELIVGEDLDSLQRELLNIIGFEQPAVAGGAHQEHILQYGFHICDVETLFGGDYFQIADDLEQYLLPEFLQTVPYDSHCLTERVAALNQQLPTEYLPFFARFKAANKSVLLTLVLRLRCDESAEGCDTTSGNYDVLMMRPSSNNASNNKPYSTRIGASEYVYLNWNNKSILLLGDLLNATMASLNIGIDGIFFQANWLQDDQLSTDRSPATDAFPYVPEDFLQIAKGLVPPWKTQMKSGEEDSAAFEETVRTYNLHAGQSVRLVGEYLRQAAQHPQRNLFLSSESSLYPNTNTLLRGISSSWEDLHTTRCQVLTNALTGLHSVNSNVCGDEFTRFDVELCVRWYQFASLTSVYRALTTVAPHRFNKFHQKLLARATRLRYALSTYLLTMRLIHPNRAINTPLLYDYPDLYADTDVNSAWMAVGASLLVAPIMTPAQHSLDVCVPDLCYEFHDGIRIPRNSTVILSIVQNDLPVFIKAGHIVAMHLVEVGIWRGKLCIKYNKYIFIISEIGVEDGSLIMKIIITRTSGVSLSVIDFCS